MAQAAIDSALAIAYVEKRRLEDAHRVLAKFADGGFELAARLGVAVVDRHLCRRSRSPAGTAKWPTTV